MENKKIYPVPEAKLKTATEVANALVHQAKFKSEQLLQEANRQASILVRQAEHSGLQQGQKKAFSSLISGESLLGEITEQSKHLIISISLEVAKELLMQELTINPASILGRVNHLVSKAVSARRIKIQVHPKMVQEVRNQIKNFSGEASQIEVIENYELSLADIKVTTEIGEVSTKLEQEFSELSNDLIANTNRIFK